MYTYTQTHTGILISHKKEWNNAICSNMDGLETIREVNQLKTNIISFVCGTWKNDMYETEIDSDTESKLMVTEEEREREG